MARNWLDTVARSTAITARTARDVEALQRGTYGRRVLRRQVRRRVSGPLSDAFWRSLFR